MVTHVITSPIHQPHTIRDRALFDAIANNDTLSVAEIAQFNRVGWVGPYALLSPFGLQQIQLAYERVAPNLLRDNLIAHRANQDAFDLNPWFKSLHAHERVFCDVAAHPAIVKRVTSILGPDVIVWGVAVVIRQPGQVHRWHVDVEHKRWPGVTAFIGISNICRDSTLNVISGSQGIDVTPQELRLRDDGEALSAAQSRLANCTRDAIIMRDGEFAVFDGPLWHGSNNTSDKLRIAVTAQYCRPNAETRIPLNWDDPIEWHDYRPPCVLVNGEDRYRVNRLVEWE